MDEFENDLISKMKMVRFHPLIIIPPHYIITRKGKNENTFFPKTKTIHFRAYAYVHARKMKKTYFQKRKQIDFSLIRKLVCYLDIEDAQLAMHSGIRLPMRREPPHLI